MLENPATAAQPVTFYVPSSSAEPMEINVLHSGLRMVLVHRNAISQIGDDWRVLGLYFLLGPDPGSPDRFWAYVGEVGKRNLLLRIHEHAAVKDWWNRALLIASVNPNGFNSAEIGWLEGRFYDVLNNAVAATVKNKGRPGDDSIPVKERTVLERYVEPTIAALRAVGAPPDTPDQQPLPSPAKRARYPGTVPDLIAASLLKPGTRLRPLRGPAERTALVLEDGALQVGSARYDSPSSAAQAVTGNKADAGWDFWGAPSGDGTFVKLHELRLRLEAKDVTHTAVAPPTSPPVKSSRHVVAKMKRHYGVKIKELIDAGLLQPGQTLKPTRAGRAELAQVTAAGRLRLRGVEFDSPTRAAIAVTGNKAEPGWDFWALESDGKVLTLHVLRSQLLKGRE